MREYLQNRRFCSITQAGLHKFQVEGVAPTNHSSKKTRLNVLFLWYDRSFFRFVTIDAFDIQTDRQTDGQTAFSSLDRVCIACSAVKMSIFDKTNDLLIVVAFENVFQRRTVKYFEQHCLIIQTWLTITSVTFICRHKLPRLKTLFTGNSKSYRWLE